NRVFFHRTHFGCGYRCQMNYEALNQRAKELDYEEVVCPSCDGAEALDSSKALCPNCEGTGRLWRNAWEEGTLSDRGLESLIELGASSSTRGDTPTTGKLAADSRGTRRRGRRSSR